ncbi:MAG: type III-A CRISPR-associated RAMP protein Csm5 [Tannerellaceae bacterium]|jgi:CRISPR/Cas system CSM-associated protein Csm5 (group 7 of RAMP superfamily)|nr:type III-A CRISPR-associated RAMP protein Csm5 [Tannerellaceae bacterium]
MSTLKIETLTPVHVGSGNLLYNNTDFVEAKIKGKDKYFLAIISEEKIWELLGKREEHMNLWLTAISKRENIKEFIRRFIPDAKSSDYAKRKMKLFSSLGKTDTLKELIHNGMGYPYIPGSSIKGAIRTAVLASLVSGKQYPSAQKVEKELFGQNPNNDIFRFLQVGDAYFEKGSEIAIRLINLNIRDSKEELKDMSKSQLVETIGEKESATFQLKFAQNHYQLFAAQNNRHPMILPIKEIQTIESLFHLINTHTLKLVAEEIEIWKKVEKTEGKSYVKNMESIKKEIEACADGKSCILRIGHASGWRFITGAWTETLSNFQSDIVPVSRRDKGNYKYQGYPFPKTRRLDEGDYLLGFVKLSVPNDK